jgi:predicted outer membrane protein
MMTGLPHSKTSVHMTLKCMLAISLTAAFAISCNKGDNPNAISSSDSEFLISANSILANQLHIGSYLNANNSYYNGQPIDGVVKGYSIQINREHQNDQQTIDSLAARFSITLNNEPDDAHKLLRQQLAMTAGRTFDSLYAHNLVDDHAILVSLCQKEANFGLNHDIKHFATLFLVNEVFHRNNLGEGLLLYLNK